MKRLFSIVSVVFLISVSTAYAYDFVDFFNDVSNFFSTTTGMATSTGCCAFPDGTCGNDYTYLQCYYQGYWSSGTQCCPDGTCAASCVTTSSTTTSIDSCHTSAPWTWNYCSPDCKCNAGEGDCDTNADCNTGYCAPDVGANYGQDSTMDVCEVGTTTTVNITTTTINHTNTTTTVPQVSIYVNVKIGSQIKEMKINLGGNATFGEFTIVPTGYTSLGDWYIKVVKGASYQEQRVLWGSLDYTNFTVAGQNVQVRVTAMSGINITTTTAPICTDSDGGEDYYTKGYVEDIFGVQEDTCSIHFENNDGSGGYSYTRICSGYDCYLTEFICTSSDTGTQYGYPKYYKCPYGCKDGACIPTPEKVVYVNVKIGAQASEMGIKFGESGTYSGYIITPTGYTNYGYWYIKLEKGSYSQEKEILGGNSTIFNIDGQEVLVTITAVETNGERRYMDQCIIGKPIITIGPSFQRAIGGERVTYTVTITNNDNYACEPTAFSRGSSWNCDAVTYVTDEYSGRDLPPINPGESLVFEMYVTTRPVESITKGVIEESVQHGRAYVVSFSNNANTTLSVLPPETEKLCNDSDGGLNYFVKGTAYAPGAQGYLEDMCFGYKLSERYCDGNEMKSLTYECLNGCVNGACIKKDVREAVSESEINNIVERLGMLKIRFVDMKKSARAIAYYYGSIGDLTNQERYNYIETTLNGAIQRVGDITNLIETNQNNIEPIREQIRGAISSLDFYLQWVLAQIG